MVKTECFTPKMWTSKVVHLQILFNKLLEVLGGAIRQKEETKGMLIGKKEIKLSYLQTKWLLIFTKNHKETTKIKKWV